MVSSGHRQDFLEANGGAPHPGLYVLHYINSSKKFSPGHFQSEIENLDRLIAGECDFDQYFLDKFRPYMGAQAEILLNMQKIHDYERDTGKKHSGRWVETAEGWQLAPQ